MLVPAEIFPWAFVYSIVKGVKSLPAAMWICLLASLALVGVSLVRGVPLIAVLGSYGSVLNVVFIFAILCHIRHEELKRVSLSAKWIMLLLVCVGLLQLMGFWSSIDGVTEFAIPRGGAEKMGAGGRGVSLLDTEPSRAGVNFLFLYIVFRIAGKKRHSFKSMLFDLTAFFFITVVTRSAMAVSIAALYFAIEYLSVKRSWIYPALLVAVFLVFYNLFDLKDIRALNILTQAAAQTNLADAWAFLVSQSGFRFVSVVGAYEWAWRHWFGGGFGTWPYVSVDSLELTGLQAADLGFFRYWHDGEYVALKPTAFMALIALEHGLVGLLLMAGWLFAKLKKMNAFSKNCRAATLTAIFTIFFAGSVGNPVPWIVLAVVPRLSAFQASSCDKLRGG